jgi:two-component system, chemotaxis family, chemotaxis protein CheY
MTGTILVVDDSGLARRSARRILEGAGYEVIEAEDGMSALEQYFVRKPAVVVLDLVMKGMYGLDVLTKLREIDSEAKVIVLSADIQTSSRDLVETGGAQAFINKPVQPAELLAAIADAMRKG